MVVAALLAVVVGQALLANGQVNLSNLQQELTLEQSAHSQAELTVAQLEAPPRIVAAATRRASKRRPTESSCPTSHCPCPSPPRR